MKNLLYGLAMIIGLSACGEQTLFTSVEDINGEQPDQANFAIFAENNTDFDGDGNIESRGFLVIASSRETICDDIAQDTLLGFLGNVAVGATDDELVTLAVAKINDTNPFVVESIQGDANNILVAGGFTISKEGVVVADTGSFDALDGNLTLNVLNEQQAIGTFQGAQKSELVNDAEIDILLEGVFDATFCQSLADQLPTLITIAP